jgi:hypothetical protein
MFKNFKIFKTLNISKIPGSNDLTQRSSRS